MISLNWTDIIFVLTINNNKYKEDITNLISKLVFIRENLEVDLYNVSDKLNYMNIQELTIFSIGLNESEEVFSMTIEEPCKIKYVELSIIELVNRFNMPNSDFMEFNKTSLYILRDGSYQDIKDMLKVIEGNKINIGRGGGQKCHILSPLDFRLSAYIMAIFSFNYKYFTYLNTFNELSKDRYLPTFFTKKIKNK